MGVNDTEDLFDRAKDVIKGLYMVIDNRDEIIKQLRGEVERLEAELADARLERIPAKIGKTITRPEFPIQLEDYE
jgi:hypothetical protein